MARHLPEGYRLKQLAETPSTNSIALAAARQGEPGGLWVVARRQTAGKGSRGRGWIGLDGNLFCSLLLKNPADTARHPELTFVMGLAVHDAIAEIIAERGLAHRIELKWPNDVLLDGAKVSGILLESHQIGGTQYVIAGIGVNCAAHPADTTYPATDLKEAGISVTASDFFLRLAGYVEHRLAAWNRGHGFARLRGDWIANAKGLGERIIVTLPNARNEGIFEGIDEKGQLRLRVAAGGVTTLSAADIFFSESQTTEPDF